MAEIVRITEGTRKEKDGFIIVYKTTGPLSEIRAVGMTAMRFPTTIVDAEVVGEQKTADGNYFTRVFVPTEGFGSAGMPNPVQWIREQFGSTFVSNEELKEMKNNE